MDTSPFAIVLVYVFASAALMVDYPLVARVSELDMQGAFGDKEFRQIGIALAVSEVLAGIAAFFVNALALPGSPWTWLFVGVLVMFGGAALRYWAIVTLGRFFRFEVVVQDSHQVITGGPYRFVRHPSYTGILLIQLGLGIALGNLLSIAVCMAVPVLGFFARIQHEEAVLEEGLGTEYRAYAARTKRLIPGIW